jgi:hypothetical protein
MRKFLFWVGFLFFLMITSPKTLLAQQATTTRSLNVGIGNNGLVVNLYYDQTIKTKNYGFRIGAGSNFAKYLKEITGSAGFYYLIGRKGNFFETGLDAAYLSIEENSGDQKGFTFLMPDKTISSFYGSMNLGYRLVGHKFVFRIGAAPGIVKNNFIPGAYTSIGIIL